VLQLLVAFLLPSDPVQERFQALFDASDLPGLSACVIAKDGTSREFAVGFADEAKQVALTPKHRFLAGSTGKTFFAALAMQLEGEGVIDLNDRLKTYLGEQAWYSRLPNRDTVTLAQLMRHQSGIPEHLDNPTWMAKVLKDPLKPWTPAECVEFSLDRDPLFAPGDGWSYSDTNFILLAMAIEAKTRKDTYAMIRERFLSKLGLKSTEPSTKIAYTDFAGGNHANGLLFPAGWSVKDGKLKITPQFEWAGGGFVTNPRDLAHWVRALMDGKVLNAKTLEKMKQSVAARTGRGHEYGYGLQVRPSDVGKSYGHSGWYPGYITDVQHFPDLGVTVCVMANTDAMGAFKTNCQSYCVELAKSASSP
jgi:D-alanyl-D-alanine carboxypeptidase